LAPNDVVEIKPEMMVDSSSGNCGGGGGGTDGKKAKKESKEERMRKLEKRVQNIERRLIREQQQQAQVQMSSQSQSQVQEFKQEVDVKPQEFERFKQEPDPLEQFKQESDPLEHFKQEPDAFRHFEQEFDAFAHFTQEPDPLGYFQHEDMDIVKPEFSQYGQDMDTQLTQGHSPPLSPHTPSSFFPNAHAGGSGYGAPANTESHQQHTRDDEMKLEMDMASLALPPPSQTAGTIREQATAILQREICEKSTKIKALLQRLMPFSTENPHSANYNPAGLDVQIVDSEGNGSADNVIKTVVL
jgi:hypothetical protein